MPVPFTRPKWWEILTTADEVVRNLMDACDELMAELTGKRATNWQKVNDALVAGGRFRRNQSLARTGLPMEADPVIREGERP